MNTEFVKYVNENVPKIGSQFQIKNLFNYKY